MPKLARPLHRYARVCLGSSNKNLDVHAGATRRTQTLAAHLMAKERGDEPDKPAFTSQGAVQTQSQVTFYKRALPCPPAVAFSSSEGYAGKRLFAEALAGGTMEGFFPLIEQFRTQDEPAFCGLASLAMVLNTLSIDPKRPWKGPWRWFHEQMLDCCKSISDIMSEGIILEQAACLARCNGARVDVVRYQDVSLEGFRSAVIGACRSPEEHLVVSYSRKAFKQTGDGHFSPIGGYHAGEDHALILDVARFKYPPHWVPIPLLHEAMGYIDPVTGKPRGFLRMGTRLQPSSVLFSLNVDSRAWEGAKHSLEQIRQLFERTGSEQEAMVAILSRLQRDAVAQFIGVRQSQALACCSTDDGSCLQPAAVQQVLKELRSMDLYDLVSRHTEVKPSAGYLREQLCVFLLMAAQFSPKHWPQEGQLLSISGRHQILKAEVDFLVAQYVEMPALQEAHRLQHEACSCKSSGDGCGTLRANAT